MFSDPIQWKQTQCLMEYQKNLLIGFQFLENAKKRVEQYKI